MSDEMGWYVDDLGRCVTAPTDMWLHMLNKGKKGDDAPFKKLDVYVHNLIGELNTVLFHRPSGGLGDMLCILPAIEQYIKMYPARIVTVAIPVNYHWLFEHLRCIVTLVDYKEFHKNGFNTSRNNFEYQYFLWCPAAKHEYESHYRPTKGRLINFSEAIGVKPVKARIYILHT